MLQTGRVQSAKKIPDVMFAEMLKKQNRLSSLQVSRDTRASHPTQALKTTITADSFALLLAMFERKRFRATVSESEPRNKIMARIFHKRRASH